MAYSIGIGVLLEGSAFNEIRAMELALADATGNHWGLIQPPHVTVKSPFLVPDLASVRRVMTIMESVAAGVAPFALQLAGISSFAESVVYLRVESGQELRFLHEQFLREIEASFPGARGPFEGEHVVFHSTLAMGLNTQQFAAAIRHLKREGIDRYTRSVRVETVGLLLNVQDQWHVVHEARFSGPLA